MILNYKTIMLYFTVSIFFIILIFIFYLFTNEKKSWFIYTYILSKVLQIVAVIGIGLRDVIPDVLSIQLSNILIIISYSIEVISINYYNAKRKRKTSILLLIITIFSSIIFVIFSYSDAYRTAVACFASVLIYGVGGFNLLKFRKNLKFPILIGSVFILYGSIQLYRAYYVLAGVDNYSFYEVNLVDTIYLFVILLHISIVSVGFLLLLKENDDVIISLKTKELEGSNLYKTKLYEIIAHDLRGPMGAMSAYGQILLDKQSPLESKEKEEIINTLATSSENTFNLLTNLLQWTQSEAGKLTANPKDVNLNTIIKSNINLLNNTIKKKQLQIVSEVGDNSVAFADSHMLDTIIRNILSNAIKFTPNKGLIRLSAHNSIGHKIVLIISDNGIGIDSSATEDIFELKSSYNKRGTNLETGTGLGLKLCKELALKNNGEIRVKSELGKGSSFEIELPIQ